MDQTKVLLVQSKLKKTFLFAGILLWIGILAGGCIFMVNYAGKAGEPLAQIPKSWPTTSHLEKSSDRASLYVFLHPKCSCSKATLAELERLMPHLINKVDVVLVFVRPAGKNDDWIQGSLLKTVQDMAGVRWVIDRDGDESHIFGVKTSGHAFLYDSKGHLVFDGGLTPARGHEGDSIGRQAILSWLENKKIDISSKSFGCSLGFKAASNGK